MHRFQRLAVGLTGLESDAGLLRYAAMVARLGTATEVHFVHVRAIEVTSESEATIQEEMRAAATMHFTAVPEKVERSYEVLAGPVLDRFLEYTASKEVHLLLLGHRRDHPGRKALAKRLAMKASCSVWMVPDAAAATRERILVPIDFSDHAADTLRVATSMASLAGHGESLALHVYFDDATATYEGYDAVLRGKESEAFRKFLQPIDTRGARVTPLFEEGANVAHVIERVAARERCDLIVMATRGRSPSAAVLLGSVTAEVMRNTEIPLLVVKHYGSQLSVLQALLQKGLSGDASHFD